MRRLVLWFFPFYTAGILLHGEISWLIAGAVVAALFFILLIKKYTFTVVFCILFVALGYLTSCLHTMHFDKKYEYLKINREYSGYVLDKTDTSVVVRNYNQGYKVIVSFYNNTEAVPGDYIVFAGHMEDKPDFKKRILCSKGIDGYVSVKYGETQIRKTNNILMLPFKLRYRINSALTKINPEGGSFISGLVTGNVKELEDETVENFQNLGISHILAVSGFNLGIIYFFILRVTMHARFSAKLRYLLSLFICLVYTAMGAFEPSVFRAFVMISIAILAKLLNRSHDVLAGITLTAWIMLTINSFYIYNIGFLLSFTATFGLILLTREIEDRIPEKLIKAKGEIAASVAAILATLPIMLWFRGFFSLITLMVNILIGPFTVAITVFSFASTILYCVTNITYLLYPSVFIGLFFIKIINFVSKFNVLVFTGAPSMLLIVVYYLMLAIGFDIIAIRLGMKTKRTVVAVSMILLVVSMKIGDNMLKIHYINVGQGESVFIETPNKSGIIIDTGPSLEKFSALKKRVIPYFQRLGYSKLSSVVFTHFHNDHAGDYQYLLDNYSVDQVFCFKNPTGSNYGFTLLSKGDSFIVDQVAFQILYPEKSNEINEQDKNEECLVIQVSYKDFSMLIPGDVEAQVLDGIHGKFDVFNLSHHGSIKSFSKKMVDDSQIGIAVVSVGKNNFGHPSPQVLEYLKESNIEVYRTDKLGSITIATDGYKYHTLFQ